MFRAGFSPGLTPEVRTPPRTDSGVRLEQTEEAAIVPVPGESLRVEMVASEGSVVAEGAPVARLRNAPGVIFTAPMPARVARVELRSGRRLSEIVLFLEAGGDVVAEDDAAASSGSAQALASLMRRSGFWRRLRSRPFGRMPVPDGVPAAIFVMAVDTRPNAPDPELALSGLEDDFARGLNALSQMTDGPVFVCHSAGSSLVQTLPEGGDIREISTAPHHPHGLAGIQIHRNFPARSGVAVWDVHAEDVAHLGILLATGRLPQTRTVSVSGPALTETRMVRCQIGADLRGLSYGVVQPGPHRLVSGSALDGHSARWLLPLDRQVTVLPAEGRAADPHWFLAALTRWSLPRPVIPTAALDNAAGAAFPVMPMVRALSVGDDETAVRLGALSLVEEDLALVDYVTGGQPHVGRLLRAMLDRAETELVG